MSIARVFPRKTTASPIDALAFYDEPGLFLPEIDAVHISVAFTWDVPRAEYLAASWARVGVPVHIGGPATGEAGGAFVPGRYLKPGYMITSRGCPNRCWFCSVWRREGESVRELPITEGWNVLDDNLLACSEGHVRAVFDMLARQSHRVILTGGLEAARLQPWHVDLLAGLRVDDLFFAYDEPADLEPLVAAGRLLMEAGFNREKLRCYVLMGYGGDTIGAAVSRCRQAWKAGFMPMAMLMRDSKGNPPSRDWQRIQRTFARPAATKAYFREEARHEH
jgi:hypothetical protein